MVTKYDTDNILPRLTGPIKEIVDLELKKGNVIFEIASTRPMINVNIWFKSPISQRYQIKYPTLKYRKLNDPHYWLEEYIDEEKGFMVAAKFS